MDTGSEGRAARLRDAVREGPSAGPWRARDGLLLGAVICVAAAVRLPRLSEGLWIDEVISLDTAAESLGRLLARTGFGDVHPPGWYLLLSAWTSLIGDGDVVARTLPLLLGLATVALLFSWARRRLGSWPATLAAGWLALSTFHAHYSVEVRSYALLALAALALPAACERWLEAPARRGRLAWTLGLEALLLWTHYFGLLVVALVNLHVFLARPRDRRVVDRWAAGQLVVLAAFAPWAPLLIVQTFELPEAVTGHLRGSLPAGEVLAALGPATAVPVAWLAAAAGVATLALAAAGLRRVPSEAPAPSDALAERRGLLAAGLAGILLLPPIGLALLPLSDTTFDLLAGAIPRAYALLGAGAAAVGLGVLLQRRRVGLLRWSVASWVVLGAPVLVAALALAREVLLVRNLLPFLAPLLLVAAAAVPRRLPVMAGVLAVVAALAVPSLLRAPEAFQPRQDLRGVAAAIAERPEAPVWVLPPWDAPGLERYLPAEQAPRTAMEPSDLPTADRLPAAVDVVLARSAAEPDDPVRDRVVERLVPPFEIVEEHAFRGVSGGLRLLRFSR
ncbi:MAG: glycosyltransferase family 39 protein [Myxococcota bacterium]